VDHYYCYYYRHIDIDDRHLLRLGHGEEALDTEESFNKAGRVSSFLVCIIHCSSNI
jgi:hypothetical protein